ncbi:hypothetical protein Tco_1449480 [Tanacetum coccineum]
MLIAQTWLETNILHASFTESAGRYRIFTKGQKQSQTGQNRAREWKERQEKSKSNPKVNGSKSSQSQPREVALERASKTKLENLIAKSEPTRTHLAGPEPGHLAARLGCAETKVATWDDLAFKLIILWWNVKHRILQNVDPWLKFEMAHSPKI